MAIDDAHQHGRRACAMAMTRDEHDIARDDPMRREHYVPQFYLRYFAAPDGLLRCYDKVNDRVIRPSTRDIAVEEGYFRVTLPDGSCRSLETTLTALENLWKTAVDAVIDKPRPDATIVLPPQQVRLVEASPVLVNFIAVQLLRPRFIRALLADAVARQPVMAEPPMDDLTFIHALFVARGAMDIPTRLINLVWHLVYNYSDTPFWTSDNPVFAHAQDVTRVRGTRVDEWLQSPGIRLHMPLTPALALVIYDPDEPLPLPSGGIVDRPWVWRANRMVVRAALRHVISPRDDFDVARRMIVNDPGLCLPMQNRAG